MFIKNKIKAKKQKATRQNVVGFHFVCACACAFGMNVTKFLF